MQSSCGSMPEFSASGYHDDRDLRFGPAPSGSIHSVPVNPWGAGRPVRVSGLTWLILALATLALLSTAGQIVGDRKSTRLNSSHLVISYAVFCLKKKKTKPTLYYKMTSSTLTTTHVPTCGSHRLISPLTARQYFHTHSK